MLTDAESVSELLPSHQAFGGQNNHGDFSESRVLFGYIAGIIAVRSRHYNVKKQIFRRHLSDFHEGLIVVPRGPGSVAFVLEKGDVGFLIFSLSSK